MAKRLNLSFDRRQRPIEKFTFYEPIIDPKDTKQRFFAGSGNITGFCELHDPKLTSYQETFKGKQLGVAVVNKNRDFNTSCGVGGVIPDPLIVSKISIQEY